MTRRGKADRIQRIAQNFAEEFNRWDGYVQWEVELELRLEKLLRKEHRAVVRIIGKDIQIYLDNARENAKDGMDPFEWDMKVEACAEILTRLKARAR